MIPRRLPWHARKRASDRKRRLAAGAQPAHNRGVSGVGQALRQSPKKRWCAETENFSEESHASRGQAKDLSYTPCSPGLRDLELIPKNACFSRNGRNG
jgi:hypothetical protein